MANGEYVTTLHNYLQGQKEKPLLTWKVSSSGPPDSLTWTVECKVGGEVLGNGEASRLRTAKDQAAKIACDALGIKV